jgi:glycosyltransferase involved in cell wall biosynthesis
VRLAFVDAIAWDYNVRSPFEGPLGGSQSAVCYLAAHLAASGQSVWLINNGSARGTIDGVEHLGLAAVTAEEIGALGLDSCIVMNDSRVGAAVRDLVGSGVPIVLWVQANTEARSTAALADPEVAAPFDAFAFVSEWQRQRYLTGFGLPPERTRVLRNAIAPAFERRVDAGAGILAAMRDPPTLVYTSVPTRGLALLVEAWPDIRRHAPSARLSIFSSMGVYRTAETEESTRLYEVCRTMPGIDYVGSVPQPVLAEKLVGAAVFAYPTEFAETACIAALEAMASGAVVVASDHGALSETTAGFGRLVGLDPDRQRYLAGFVRAVISVLDRAAARDPELERELRAQVEFVNDRYTWRQRARDWTAWLSAEIVGMRRGE